MENNKLVSMTEFVLNQSKKIDLWNTHEHLQIIINYANFLNQPLTLGMFIPVDEEGEVLEEPKNFSPDYEDEFNSIDRDSNCYAWYNDCKAYKAAKERVLFEGEFYCDEFEMHLKGNDDFFLDLLVFEEKSAIITIEELDDCGLVITPSALKQIGINEIPELK